MELHCITGFKTPNDRESFTNGTYNNIIKAVNISAMTISQRYTYNDNIKSANTYAFNIGHAVKEFYLIDAKILNYKEAIKMIDTNIEDVILKYAYKNGYDAIQKDGDFPILYIINHSKVRV